MRIASLTLVACVGLAACASTASFTAAEDRASGQVLVMYQTGDVQSPPLSLEHSNYVATQRCKKMGYSFTERDVGVTQQCSATDTVGQCTVWKVAQTYQCAGNAVAQTQFRPAVVIPNTGASRP